MTIPAHNSFHVQKFEVTPNVRRYPLQLLAANEGQIQVFEDGHIRLNSGSDYQIEGFIPGVSGTLVVADISRNRELVVRVEPDRSQPYDISADPCFDGVVIEDAMDHVALDIAQSVHEARLVKPGDGSVGPDQLDAGDAERRLAIRERLGMIPQPNFAAEPFGGLMPGGSVEFA